MMNKYLVKIGFDHGGPEDGPIIHTGEELIEAESEQDAENKVNNKYGYGRDESYCGCSVKLASDEEINKYEEELKESEEYYKMAIESGVLMIDEEMCKHYEELESRRDHLLEIADQVGFNKWIINQDDSIMIDTEKMNDEEIIKYMEDYRYTMVI